MGLTYINHKQMEVLTGVFSTMWCLVMKLKCVTVQESFVFYPGPWMYGTGGQELQIQLSLN